MKCWCVLQVEILSLQTPHCSEPLLYFYLVCSGGTLIPTYLALISSTDIRLSNRARVSGGYKLGRSLESLPTALPQDKALQAQA